MQVFGMSTLEDEPDTEFFPKSAVDLKPHQRRRLFLLGVQQIMDRFIHVSYPASQEPENDHMFAYTK